MKMLVGFVAASVLMVAGSSRAQDKPNDSKLYLDALDKVYGLKTKSVVVDEVKPRKTGIQTTDTPVAKTKITITFNFSRDMKDLPELLSLHETLAASTGVPFRFDNLPLIFHFFDEDNVCIDKIIISATEGDLSGVKGDAFRVFLSCRTEAFDKAKRIEARYYPPLR